MLVIFDYGRPVLSYGCHNNTTSGGIDGRVTPAALGGRVDRFESDREPMSPDGAYLRRRLPGDVTPVDLERLLWVLVVLSLIGDVVTTFVGLHLGLSESNPVARSVIHSYGLVGMLALKGAAIAIGLICRPMLPKAYRAIVPAGLAAPWTVAVCINLYMIATVS